MSVARVVLVVGAVCLIAARCIGAVAGRQWRSRPAALVAGVAASAVVTGFFHRRLRGGG